MGRYRQKKRLWKKFTFCRQMKNTKSKLKLPGPDVINIFQHGIPSCADIKHSDWLKLII